MAAELLLVLETGAGLTNSNCYTSLQEAEMIFVSMPEEYKLPWTSSDAYRKTQSLIYSTAILDDWVIWPGVQSTSEQALQNPRSGIVNPSGYLLPSYTIHPFIKRANCQMALVLLETNTLEEPPRGIDEIQVGPIDIKFNLDSSKQKNVIPQSVSSILIPYGCVIRSSSRASYASAYYERA